MRRRPRRRRTELGRRWCAIWAPGLTGGTISADEVSAYTIVWELRFPRAVLAAVVGAGLSAIGVAVQALVRNALADPFVLGISSGAAVGANAVLLFGALGALGVWALSVSAFVSALIAMVLVYAAARTAHGLTPLRLVLTGTAMYYGFSAVTTLMVFTADRGEAARSAMMWLLGSLSGAGWGSVPIAAAAVAAALAHLLLSAGRLNALAMGDETAAALGVDAERLRRELFVVAAAGHRSGGRGQRRDRLRRADGAACDADAGRRRPPPGAGGRAAAGRRAAGVGRSALAGAARARRTAGGRDHRRPRRALLRRC